jgi:hypothetical protein
MDLRSSERSCPLRHRRRRVSSRPRASSSAPSQELVLADGRLPNQRTHSRPRFALHRCTPTLGAYQDNSQITTTAPSVRGHWPTTSRTASQRFAVQTTHTWTPSSATRAPDGQAADHQRTLSRSSRTTLTIGVAGCRIGLAGSRERVHGPARRSFRFKPCAGPRRFQ